MSLVSKISTEQSDDLLSSLVEQINELKQEVSTMKNKKGPRGRKAAQNVVEPDMLHIFEFSNDDDYVSVALVDKSAKEVSPVIRISKKNMEEYAQKILDMNVKQKIRITEYEMTDDTAVFINDEWLLSTA